MSPVRNLILAATTAVVSVGCGTTGADAPPQKSLDGPQPNGSELTEGAAIYAALCGRCHGPTGAGSDDAPPLVGARALPLDPPLSARIRRSRFTTAKDLFDFIKANMPIDKPGRLTDDQVYEVLTFVLERNKVELNGLKLDATLAPTILLPRTNSP